MTRARCSSRCEGRERGLRLGRWLLPAFTCLLCAVPRVVEACSVCFGNPDSPHTHGMNNAILFLLAVIGGVLVSLAAFFICLMRRSRLAAEAAGGAGGLSEGSSAKNNGMSH